MTLAEMGRGVKGIQVLWCVHSARGHYMGIGLGNKERELRKALFFIFPKEKTAEGGGFLVPTRRRKDLLLLPSCKEHGLIYYELLQNKVQYEAL